MGNPRHEQKAGGPAQPWYKRVWVIVSCVGAMCYAILLHGPTMLANARVMPAEFLKVKSQFMGWYYEDESWRAFWTAHPEGLRGVEDDALSDTDVQIVLESTGGDLQGAIAAKTICRSFPMWDWVLLDGQVGLSGSSAEVMAYDFVDG